MSLHWIITMNKVTYYAFSDESYGKKYEGLGMISLPFSQLNPIENKVRSICENDISKIKWNKIKGYDKQSLAFKIMEHIIQMALEGKLRVDVLIWDKTDSRHNIPQRDDTDNLQRMYYHLFNNVMSKRWPKESFWKLYPDRNNRLDWEKLESILKSKGVKINSTPNGLKLNCKFYVVDIQESTPSDYPLINVADLFVGMGRYSWKSYEKVHEKLKEKEIQAEQAKHQLLFPPKKYPFKKKTKFSRADHHRCELIYNFYKKCKENKLRIGLKTSPGLKTYNPTYPINFWLYEPQSKNDKSPTK